MQGATRALSETGTYQLRVFSPNPSPYWFSFTVDGSAPPSTLPG
jgi:hypothetical protein